jgi:hypothetical protein
VFAAVLTVCLLTTTACSSGPGRDAAGRSAAQQDGSAKGAEAAGQAQLGGRYIQRLAIGGGPWEDVGPGQVVEVTFAAEGLAGIGQFDVTVTLEGPIALNLAGAQFVPEAPFVTLGNGTEAAGEGGLRFVAVNLARSTNGTAKLGTLRLRMPAGITLDKPLRLTVSRVSVGPTSKERDTYTAAQLGLSLSIGGR